jgi:antirestriction protein ArdC
MDIKWSDYLKEIVEQEGILSACYSVFHDYSIGNQLHAYSQLKARGLELSPIASYKKWQSLGRQVKKGEKALSLLMPITIKEKDEDGKETGKVFRIFKEKSNWFSLGQTEGDDFVAPAIQGWDAELALKTLDIKQVAFEHTNGNCQGYASEREIAINPVAALPHKTRFHEMAHVVLGHTTEGLMADSEHTPKDIREVEAESVAYILCKALNLAGDQESRGYIQHWLGSQEISDKSAQRIFSAADKILKAGKQEAEVAEA